RSRSPPAAGGRATSRATRVRSARASARTRGGRGRANHHRRDPTAERTRRAHGRRRYPERAGARALGAPPRPLAAPRLRRRVDGAAGTRARLLSDLREKFYPELPAIRFAIYDVLSGDGGLFPRIRANAHRLPRGGRDRHGDGLHRLRVVRAGRGASLLLTGAIVGLAARAMP